MPTSNSSTINTNRLIVPARIDMPTFHSVARGNTTHHDWVLYRIFIVFAGLWLATATWANSKELGDGLQQWAISGVKFAQKQLETISVRGNEASQRRTPVLLDEFFYNDAFDQQSSGCKPLAVESVESSLTLPQEDWQCWLTNSAVLKSSAPRAGHFRNDSSCGFTMQMTMESANLVLFKAAFAGDINHKTAETHLREIKAAYLDRILGLGVVLPCAGVVLDRKEVEGSFPESHVREYQAALSNSTGCVSESSGKSLKGAIMLYAQSLERTSMETALATAIRSKVGTLTYESAVKYAVFLYLAGCMKSPHNHFQIFSGHFVAVDNDRCFIPEHIMKGTNVPQNWYELFGVWERLVFEICDFPPFLLETLQDANSAVKLSDRLRAALADDTLADDLLAEQPEALLEVDARAHKLLQHMESCQFQQT